MQRRGFLTALAGSVGAMTLDPERLLWRSGAKLISIPAPTRLSVRWINGYDATQDKFISRMDVQYGLAGELHQSGAEFMANSKGELESMERTHRELIEYSFQRHIQPRIGLVVLVFPAAPEIVHPYSEFPYVDRYAGSGALSRKPRAGAR